MHIYESHMGGIYASEYELDYESRHCDICNDTDSWLGEVFTREELIELCKEEGYCDYMGHVDYIFPKED